MASWLRDAVFYEIYPSSFMDANGDGYGDFEGIIQKLDYVLSTGCNAIWLNPCFKSPFCDGGYDVSDFFDVSERFGDLAQFDALVAACKERGIRLVLDLVAGHASEQNPMFLKSAQPAENDMSSRFIWTDSPWDMPNDVRCVSGRHERHGNYVVNFFSTQPALNYGYNRIEHKWQLPYTHEECMKTRQWLKSVIRYWLDRGVDGFRVDMADSLVKNDDDKSATMELWRDVKSMMTQQFPESVLISEWSCPRRALQCGFDCDFILDHWGKGYNNLFRKELTGSGNSYFNKNGGGDARRAMEEFADYFKYNKDNKFVSFITGNHDTVRLSALYDDTQLSLIYATLLCLPGVPFIYYGDEIGMRYQGELKSKECGFARTGSRTPMQWTSGENAGFSAAAADKLYLPTDSLKRGANVQDQEKAENSLVCRTREIIRLRKELPQLTSDDFKTLYCESNAYPLLFQRQNLVVCVNPLISIARAPISVSGELIFSIGQKPCAHREALVMPPLSFAVYEC